MNEPTLADLENQDPNPPEVFHPKWDGSTTFNGEDQPACPDCDEDAI